MSRTIALLCVLGGAYLLVGSGLVWALTGSSELTAAMLILAVFLSAGALVFAPRPQG